VKDEDKINYCPCACCETSRMDDGQSRGTSHPCLIAVSSFLWSL